MSEYNGLTGLANLGNTCFLNSCMQIFSHTPEINKFLDKDHGAYKQNMSNRFNKKYAHDCKLLLEWDELRKLMWKENCIISPGKFLKTVQHIAKNKDKDIFTGYAQNDLPEFLLFIMDSFHNALRREVNMEISGDVDNKRDKLAYKCYEMMKKMYENEYSEIVKLYYGIHVSKIVDKKNNDKTLSIRPEPYFMLDLPIPNNKKNVSLYDCFDEYCKIEILEKENAWLNEKTNKKEDVCKYITFWNLPTILVIAIKRFDYRGKKIQSPVNLEINNLDLCKYVEGYNSDSYKYKLYGVCNHSGGTLGGHYTANILVKDKWFLFNDTNVSEIKFDGLNNTSGYCLFYRKIED